ncbi:MAG: hypothetical protein QMC80_03410 [Thermoplasmatales archaeon]|nr:hypothetical protein [Thermoplasmatales archaeon]
MKHTKSKENFTTRDYVRDHMEIMEKLRKHIRKNGDFVDVNKFAKSLSKDPRTVRAHLEIAALHNDGSFISNGRYVYCSKNGVKNLYEKLNGGDRK